MLKRFLAWINAHEVKHGHNSPVSQIRERPAGPVPLSRP